MEDFDKINSGTYAAIKYTKETREKLKNLQASLQLPFPVPEDKLHTTICFSRKWIPYNPVNDTDFYIGTGTKLDIFEHNGKRAVVLLLDSPWCRMRHEYANILGATYDFPDYKPHITLAYDIGDINIDMIEFKETLDASFEYVEKLDLDWSAN